MNFEILYFIYYIASNQALFLNTIVDQMCEFWYVCWLCSFADLLSNCLLNIQTKPTLVLTDISVDKLLLPRQICIQCERCYVLRNSHVIDKPTIWDVVVSRNFEVFDILCFEGLVLIASPLLSLLYILAYTLIGIEVSEQNVKPCIILKIAVNPR